MHETNAVSEPAVSVVFTKLSHIGGTLRHRFDSIVSCCAMIIKIMIKFQQFKKCNFSFEKNKGI